MTRPDINDKKAMDIYIASLDPDPLRDQLEVEEAKSYLASGGRPREWGFDLADAAVYAQLVSVPAKQVVGIELRNLPPQIQAQIDLLPENWQEIPSTHEAAEAINIAVEQYYNLPSHLYASLNDTKKVWVDSKP